MTHQGDRRLQSARVPQTHERIAASGCKAAAVSADAHRFDGTTVTLDAMKQCPVASAPDQHVPGCRAGDKVVRRSGETVDRVARIADPRDQPARHAAPDLYRPALSCGEDGEIVGIDR